MVTGCDVLYNMTMGNKSCSLPYTETLGGKLKWEIFHDAKRGRGMGGGGGHMRRHDEGTCGKS